MNLDAWILVVVATLCAWPIGVLAEPACDVALAELSQEFHGPPGHYALVGVGNLQRVKLVMDEAGPCLSKASSRRPDQNMCGWIEISDKREAPARPLAKATLEMLTRSPIVDAATACPTLTHATRSILGWGAPSKRLRIRRNGLYAFTGVGITLPVVAAAQGEAIAWVETRSGPLAGGGAFVLLRVEANGHWRLVAVLPLLTS